MDHSDIQVLKTYGAAPYATALKRLEKQINEKQASVNEKIGIKVLYSVDVSSGIGLMYVARNPTPDSHLHTFGTLPQTGNVWPRSSPCKSLAVQKLSRMKRIRIRANMSSTSSRLPSSLST